tara:strand:- start:972 stop:2405 length:1434 start_codon:yes stop_codon:yes gene_type:complete
MLFKDSSKRQEKAKIKKLVMQYGGSAFMYTQYPHKRFWEPKKNDVHFKEALVKEGEKPSLLYVHMPYCQQLCYFCTCHMAITKDYSKVNDYVKVLCQEIDLFAKFVSDNNIKLDVKEIHLGGGSPTFMNIPDFDILCEKLGQLANIQDLNEFAIEMDPRRVDINRLKHYAKKGINRLSIGVQDFDIDVQKAINRVQPAKLIEDLLTEEVRELFSNGINFDILCGLPLQTPETIKATAEECIRLHADRICLNYVHYSPTYAPHQQLMVDGTNGRPDRMPDFFERKELFCAARDVLVASGGYVRTGYDHFAKSDDSVALALDEKTMHWNSLGVTSGEYTNIIGLGISSESTIGNCYFQNHYDLPDYVKSIRDEEFPVYREHELSQDDAIRKDVIQQLRNYFEVNLKDISSKYGIDALQYFQSELKDIEMLENDEVLTYKDDVILLSDLGRQFTNIVCRVFDLYYTGTLLSKDLGQRAAD